MKVLVIGSGGREHALCWKARQSQRVDRLLCAPGNPGISQVAEIVPIAADDVDGLVACARSQAIDLTIVGPEAPLSLGIVDRFRAEGLRIFGPAQEAARLEASKSFAKEVMIAAGVPTARSETVQSRAEAEGCVRRWGTPIVLKADGLAAGKGVFVCHREQDAAAAIEALFGELRAAQVVVEEFLEGIEVSYMVATNGREVFPLASSHDYKRVGENDTGPNTGGMGSVSPTPRLSTEQERWIIPNVIAPVIREMERRGAPFTGFLYAGLMLTPQRGMFVLEFNTRLGDPETQSILRRCDSDLVEFLYSLAVPAGEPPEPLRWSPHAAVTVVLAAEGYPGEVRRGDRIEGLEFAATLPHVQVFHAGTSCDARGRVVTAGGRVLGVTGIGGSVDEASRVAFKGCDMIQFRGRHLRRDVGREGC